MDSGTINPLAGLTAVCFGSLWLGGEKKEESLFLCHIKLSQFTLHFLETNLSLVFYTQQLDFFWLFVSLSFFFFTFLSPVMIIFDADIRSQTVQIALL